MIPFVSKVLDTDIKLEPYFKEIDQKHVTQRNINQPFLDDLESTFNSDQYSFSDNERILHSHGQNSPDEVFKVLYDKLEKFADLVFYIESEDDVIKLIDLAKKHNVCLVPFGGGTNVTNALQLPNEEKRMIVSVDTRRMNKIESIDEKNLIFETLLYIEYKMKLKSILNFYIYILNK